MTKSQQLEPVLPAIPYIYDYGSGPVLCFADPYLGENGGGILADDQTQADAVVRERQARRKCPINRLMMCEERHYNDLREKRRKGRPRWG